MATVSKEQIEAYFNGKDEEKYIIDVRCQYFTNVAKVIINDPVKGKRIVNRSFKSFIWVKQEVIDTIFDGNIRKFKKQIRERKIKVKLLETRNDKGEEPERMKNGFKYLFSTTESYNNLLGLFRDGGLGVYDEKTPKNLFFTLPLVEQFFVSTGKRLFKGFEDYDDIHRLQFDLETEGLDPTVHRIFLTGMKDNRGLNHIIETQKYPSYDNLTEDEIKAVESIKDKDERYNIELFFNIIDELKPDIIAGYNSEFFDWEFIFKRCEILGIDITEVSKTLDKHTPIRRQENQVVKIGSETEYYTKHPMWGYIVADIMYAVRRAQAIDSNMMEHGLKYVTKYAEANKENRVYVPGDEIYNIWQSTDKYAYNIKNGDWYKITDKTPIKDEYKEVDGSVIIKQYLLDDLWETETVDKIYNQASFLVGKILPTSFERVLTMGTASLWKLLMTGWSYENNLAIPNFADKETFVGGLARLLEVGYAEDVSKLDYAALYPNTELTWDIKPTLDISGAMMAMLFYMASTRDIFKALKNEASEAGDEKLANVYDKKQLPLKIFANAFFGSFGAPYLFPWGDIDSAEETTCRGRQYFRLLVYYFQKKHGYKALVGDTDGVNFSMPKGYEDYRYVSDGTHRFNVKGKEYKGLDAAVAEFNDLYMIGRMGLDVDEIALATVNFSRKNYADKLLKKGKIKIKLVGNTLHSKGMPGYIEDFFKVSIPLLLDNKGYEFLELYYETVEKIYNGQIPMIKIASKSRIKKLPEAYKKHIKKKNKNGKPMPRQAHMELVLQHNLNVGLGDTIYYVNTAKKKSIGDIKTVIDKETGEPKVQINCVLLDRDKLNEIDPNLEYNVAKYISNFNEKVKPLLVVFHPDIRNKIITNKKGDEKIKNNILINAVTNRKTKELELEPRPVFTIKETQLTAGFPIKADTQDDLEKDVMTISDPEIKFWIRVNKEPNNLDDIGLSSEKWKEIVEDYKIRKVEKERQTFNSERRSFLTTTYLLEYSELEHLLTLSETDPEKVIRFIEKSYPYVKINYTDNGVELMSKKLDKRISYINGIFQFMDDAKLRAQFYRTTEGLYDNNRIEKWLEFKKFNNINDLITKYGEFE
jgi:DNA polymerase elongation subunit (family B)